MGVVGLQGFEGIADMYHPKPQDFKMVGQTWLDLWGGYHIATPPKIHHCQLLVDVKEVVFVGNLLQKQSRYTITFEKDEHILRSESTTFLEGNNLF